MRQALEPSGRILVYAGTAVPLALLAIGLLLPGLAPGANMLAGLAALAAGWRLKFVLVRRAAYNQGFLTAAASGTRRQLDRERGTR